MLGDIIASLVLFVCLSECDVGASKAVVNGLAPGSNGQDKGKLWRGSPAGDHRAALAGAEYVWPGPPACHEQSLVKMGRELEAFEARSMFLHVMGPRSLFSTVR